MVELSSYGGAKKALKQGTKQKPVLVIYYAEWCGHCQRRKELWSKFESQFGDKVKVYKLESKHLQGGEITGFPTYQINKGNGVQTMGAKEEEEPETMKREVLGGGRRSDTRRLRRRRGKMLHRTLRRYVTFI
jgi:thiol-disulfide isomerase/thioredoxin